MIDKRVAIGALARNCDENLPSNIERIEELRRKFSGSAIFVYENNSTDSTKSILKKWNSASNGVYVKTEDIDETTYKSKQKVGRLYHGTEEGRIRKMCVCRNKLLDMICNNGPFDYVIFIDIDIEWFSIDGVVSTIQNAPEGWSGLFANCYVKYSDGKNTIKNPMHYDTFAYLEKGAKPENIKFHRLNMFRRLITANRVYKYITRENYHRCESAFGGIGVYLFSEIKDIEYEIFIPKLWNKRASALCEHILFNHRLKGNKYISNDMTVCYSNFKVGRYRWPLIKHSPLAYSFLCAFKSLF